LAYFLNLKITTNQGGIMSKAKKTKKTKKGILARIKKRITKAHKGGPIQAGKIDLRSQQWTRIKE